MLRSLSQTEFNISELLMYGHSNKITENMATYCAVHKMCPWGFQWPASVSLEEWFVIARLMVGYISGDQEHNRYGE